MLRTFGEFEEICSWEVFARFVGSGYHEELSSGAFWVIRVCCLGGRLSVVVVVCLWAARGRNEAAEVVGRKKSRAHRQRSDSGSFSSSVREYYQLRM